MAQPTVQDIINGTLSRLGEATNSPAGALQSGTGGTPVLATNDTIVHYINLCKNELCREAIAIEDSGTVTPTAGTRSIPYSALTVTSGGLIWSAFRNGVQYGSVVLQQAARSHTDIYSPGGPFDPNGTPLYWVNNSPTGILIAPKNASGSTVLTVYGLSTPADYVIGTLTAPITWIEPDNAKLIEYYCAAMLGRMNAEDPSLSERVQIWDQQYQQGKLALQMRMLRQAPDMVAQYFPQAIQALRAATGAKG